MDQAYAEIERLENENKDQVTIIGDLTKQLSEANEVLEGQEKGRLIGEISAGWCARHHDGAL